MKIIIDRFEGEYAICENELEEMIKIDKNKLPAGVSEGDVLILEGEKIALDKNETQIRKEKIKKLMEKLWE